MCIHGVTAITLVSATPWILLVQSHDKLRLRFDLLSVYVGSNRQRPPRSLLTQSGLVAVLLCNEESILRDWGTSQHTV